MSQQGLVQASIRAVTGSEECWEGDWHRLFDMAGISDGSINLTTGIFEPLGFNERLLLWINSVLSAAYTSIVQAQAAFAAYVGAYNWSSLGTFDASVGSGGQLNFENAEGTGLGLATNVI